MAFEEGRFKTCSYFKTIKNSLSASEEKDSTLDKFMALLEWGIIQLIDDSFFMLFPPLLLDVIFTFPVKAEGGSSSKSSRGSLLTDIFKSQL